jgi:hypothetical protein
MMQLEGLYMYGTPAVLGHLNRPQLAASPAAATTLQPFSANLTVFQRPHKRLLLCGQCQVHLWLPVAVCGALLLTCLWAVLTLPDQTQVKKLSAKFFCSLCMLL